MAADRQSFEMPLPDHPTKVRFTPVRRIVTLIVGGVPSRDSTSVQSRVRRGECRRCRAYQI